MKLGWIPDTKDYRDFVVDCALAYQPTATKKFDLRRYIFAPPYLQTGNSCVAQALERAVAIRHAALGEPYRQLSRRFLYFNARAYAGTQWHDRGCSPRLALRGLRQFGAPLCDLWPESRAAWRRPSWSAYMQAYAHKGLEYQRIECCDATVESARHMISQKVPLVVGLEVSQEFVADKTGVIQRLPKKSEIVGRHMVAIVGYDSVSFTIINSWGTSWGSGGFGRISNEYLEESSMGDLYAIL